MFQAFRVQVHFLTTVPKHLRRFLTIVAVWCEPPARLCASMRMRSTFRSCSNVYNSFGGFWNSSQRLADLSK